MPSSDTLDRSIHSYDSKQLSQGEIINRLRKANAALTDKTAEMEATFMNQCNVLATEISEQAAVSKEKDDKFSSLNARLVRIKGKSEEKDILITSLENEQSFQKQTITDLKNQMFQMQNEMEDIQFSKSEDSTAHQKKQGEAEFKIAELKKEVATLQFSKSEDSAARQKKQDEAELKIAELEKEVATSKSEDSAARQKKQGEAELKIVELEKELASSKSEDSAARQKKQDEAELKIVELEKEVATLKANQDVDDLSPEIKLTASCPATPDRSETRQNWQQLEGVREKYQETETLLHETQSALATLEHKHKAALKQFSEVENQLKDGEKQFVDLKSTLNTRDERVNTLELERKAALEKLEDVETQLHGHEKTREKQVSELKDLLSSRDEIVANLHQRLETCTEDLTKAEQEIDDLTSHVDSEKVKQMATDLERAGTLLEKEKFLTSSLTEQYEVLCKTVEKLQEETNKFTISGGNVEQRVAEKDESILSLKVEVDKLQEENNESKISRGNAEQIIAQKDESISSLKEELELFRSSITEQKDSTEMFLNLKSNKISELDEKLQKQTRQIEKDAADQALVLTLRAEIEELVCEKKKVEAEFESTISATEAEVERLRSKIDAQLRKITTMETSYTKEISKFSAEIAILRETMQEGSDTQTKLHKEQMANLKEDISKLKTSHEQAISEARQDIETHEDVWKNERLQMQAKISTLESELSLMTAAKEKLEEARREISTFKCLDEAGEVQLLREELRKVKEASSEDENGSKYEKQTSAKRAYLLAIERRHKKELAEIERQRKTEIAALKSKLSDRDTTIASTIKSSVAQDQEIKNLQLRITKLKRGPQALDLTGSRSSTFDDNNEIKELQKSVTNLLKKNTTMATQITTLKMQLSETMTDRMSSFPSHDDKKKLNDYQLKLRERDGAIATLVKSSITQEQQITALREEIAGMRDNTKNDVSYSNGPSWQDFTRLQQESEMFAGQIIELDEEIEEVRQRLMDGQQQGEQAANLIVAVEELGNQLEEQKRMRAAASRRYGVLVDGLKAELEEEKDLKIDLEAEVKTLKAKAKKTSKLARVQDELDEVEETNHRLQHEVRELRRKMRNAQLEAEKVPHLESEIAVMQGSFNRMKIDSVKQQTDEMMDAKMQSDLQHVIEERDAKETELRKFQGECMRLEVSIVSRQEKELKMKSEINGLKVLCKEAEDTLETRIDEERARYLSLSDAKDAAELKSRRIVADLKDKIKELENDIDEQNEIISALTSEVKKLRSSSVDDSDGNDIILALTEEVKKLRSKQMSAQGDESDVIQALSEEVRGLHSALKRKEGAVEARDIEATVRAEIGDELRSMKSQKEFLANEVSRLQSALDSLENDDSRIKELKQQVEQAEKGRTQFEKTMISTYERKLNLMQMNKDLTIDGLRKELAKCKESMKEVEADLLSKIRTLESEKMEIEAELQAKMQHKNAKINFLEQTLSAHEQVSGSMKDELDQLQSGMENVSVSRRAEVEEIQEDLMGAQAKLTKYERKITSMKMEVEERRLQHQNEVKRLEQTINSMESDTETPMMRDVAMEREKRLVNDYRQQLKDLMTKVNILQEENVTIKQQSENDGKLRSSNNDKWRNSALQEQVIKLQSRLREYEGDTESVQSSSSRRSTRSEYSPRIPRTPSGSYSRRDSSSRKSGRDDISTYTETTF
jgi:chromosome segregation ATPase